MSSYGGYHHDQGNGSGRFQEGDHGFCEDEESSVSVLSGEDVVVIPDNDSLQGEDEVVWDSSSDSASHQWTDPHDNYGYSNANDDDEVCSDASIIVIVVICTIAFLLVTSEIWIDALIEFSSLGPVALILVLLLTLVGCCVLSWKDNAGSANADIERNSYIYHCWPRRCCDNRPYAVPVVLGVALLVFFLVVTSEFWGDAVVEVLSAGDFGPLLFLVLLLIVVGCWIRREEDNESETQDAVPTSWNPPSDTPPQAHPVRVVNYESIPIVEASVIPIAQSR